MQIQVNNNCSSDRSLEVFDTTKRVQSLKEREREVESERDSKSVQVLEL